MVESRGGAVARIAPFPPPAHRTGRADFPHPALGEGSRFRMRQAARVPLQLEQAETLFQPAAPSPAPVQTGTFVFGEPPLAEPVRDMCVDGPVGFRAWPHAEVI